MAQPRYNLARFDFVSIRLAVLCASPVCGYLSGTVLHVDGGQQYAPN